MASMIQFCQARNQLDLAASLSGAFAAQLVSFSNSTGTRSGGNPRWIAQSRHSSGIAKSLGRRWPLFFCTPRRGVFSFGGSVVFLGVWGVSFAGVVTASETSCSDALRRFSDALT